MASMMETFKANLAGNKAYREHVTGNRLLDASKFEEAKQRFDRAMQLYTEALGLGCDKTNILMAYSLLLMRYGRAEEARDLMLKVDARRDISPAERRQLRINYAVCQWKLGDLDKAIQMMKQLGEAGMTGMLYNTLGLFLVEKAAQTGDFAEALEFCAKAYEYDEEDGDTLDNLGQLHLAISRKATADGDAEKAQTEWKLASGFLTRALARKPHQVTSLYCYAEMCLAEGKKEEARAALKKAQAAQIGTLCPISKEQIAALLQKAES